MRRLLTWVLLAGAGVTACIAQNNNHYSIRSYTAIDGLPQSQVNAIIEDKNGYLWIGTEGGGLARFDGHEFKVYTTLDGLLTNFVKGLKLDSKQNLWIQHSAGITKFDGITFTKYQSPGNTHSAKRLRKLFVVKDTVYTISYNGQLSTINPDSMTYQERKLLKNDNIRMMHQAVGGELCLYLESGRFLILRNGEQYFIEPDNSNHKYLSMFNHESEVWISSEEGMFRLDLSQRRMEKLPFPIKNFVALYDEEEDVFWTCDWNNNLMREQWRNGVMVRDTVIRDIEVMQVSTDSERNVWIASYGQGLLKYYTQDFDRLPPFDLRGIMSIEVDHEGARWMGSMNKGLWKVKKGKVTSYVDKKEVERNAIHYVREAPDGTLWVATSYGLGKYNRCEDKFTWFTKKDGLSGNSIMNLTFDEKGGMWLGAMNGVNYYNGSSFKYYGPETGMSPSAVWAICYLKALKTLYVGNESGINTIKDNKVSSLSIPELENTMVLSLHPYRDTLLLVGTGGSGIEIFDPLTYSRKLITTREGLNSDFVYFVAADPEGKIWVGTERGISRLCLNENLEITENLYYDYDNGLTGIETNQNAFYLGEKNKYFGLVDGLYEFNDMSKVGAKPFDLHLTSVDILYGEYSACDYSDSLVGFFKIPYNPMLPPDKNHLTFHFNKVDKRYPKSVKFRYFLQNFDKTWSQPSSANQVTYSNLPPGDYIFRVMATNSEGSWAESKIAYPFTVRIPFYRTASFIAGIIIFVAGNITLLMYLRVRQRVQKMIDTERIRLRELEILRKEIARDFHDDMGNQLTRIINYISLMKLNGVSTASDNGKHKDLYTKVEESAKYLYAGTRDFIWAIDPGNDELTKLFIYIRDFGEKLFEEKGIQFRAYDYVKEQVKLPYGFSREANLIFKEAMTNSFKHSQAANATFVLQRLEDGFEMTFEDDGTGFCPEEQEKSNGLKNIHERAQRIHALLRINSEKQHGTRITLDFKLIKPQENGIAF